MSKVIRPVQGSTHYDLDFKRHLKYVDSVECELCEHGIWWISSNHSDIKTTDKHKGIIETTPFPDNHVTNMACYKPLSKLLGKAEAQRQLFILVNELSDIEPDVQELDGCFVFNKSPQGGVYWRSVHQGIMDKGFYYV